MLISFGIWLVMGFAAVTCGLNLNFPMAALIWAGIVAGVCAVGAFLISQQPIGIVTWKGWVGSSAVHWGFRAGRGQMLPAAGISWLVWLILGCALMGALQSPEHAPIIAAWAGDLLGLFYVLGMMLASRGNGQLPTALIKIALAIVVVISGSAFLWLRAGTDGARAIAFFFAGGPPLFIGLGYGVTFTINMIGARRRGVR